MKKYYTKIRNVFKDSAFLRIQRVGGDVYISNDHILVRFPDWLYWDEFVMHPDNINSLCAVFPTVQDGERLIVKYGETSENGQDMTGMWRKLSDYDYHLVRFCKKGKFENRSVRFLDSGLGLPVILNNKYYEAMEQATRRGISYCGNKNNPVWFYDSVEIPNSAFCGCVLPINYNPDKLKVPA